MLFNPKYNLQYKPLSVWFIGLPCSGKTTVSTGVLNMLKQEGFNAKLLDGDNLRKGVNSNLGFSVLDRHENIRRVAEINNLFLSEGYIVLNALICPMADMRMMVGNIVGRDHFCEVFVDAPLPVCEERDVKGMYKKARAGEISHFTGINSPFEPPVHPGVIVKTDKTDIDTCVSSVFNHIKNLIFE